MTDRLEVVRAALEHFRPGPVVTPAGVVDLAHMAIVDGCVSVMVDGPAGGDPHFRIYNPPTTVPDAPEGRQVDPVAAIAHAVALAGGARRDRRRRA